MYYYLLPGTSKIGCVVSLRRTASFIIRRLSSCSIGDRLRWYSFGRSDVDFGREEWKALMESPDDLNKLTGLGTAIYHDCAAEAGLEPDPGLDVALEAIAHVVYHMSEVKDEDLWMDLVFFLQQRWRFKEQSFWESPEMLMMANAEAERAVRKDSLVDLLLIGDAMRSRVRPAVFRLVWCMMISAGLMRSMDSVEANDPSGNLLVPSVFLREMVEERVPDFFDDKESSGLQTLLEYLRLRERGSIADEVARAISSRGFWTVEGGAVIDLYLHQEGGLEIEEDRIVAWRRCAVHLSACMAAFNVMLVGMAMAKGIDIMPPQFRDRREKKRLKQPSLTAASP
jgi:hypothetical protein